MKRFINLNFGAFLCLNKLVAGYVTFDFEKSRGPSYEEAQFGVRPSLEKFVNGEGSLEIALNNEQVFYSVALAIGTPAQEVTVLFDTGSSDLWVSASTNPYCSSDPSGEPEGDELVSTSTSYVPPVTTVEGIPISPTMDCSLYGVFDPSKSSTFKANKSDPFYIQYGDLSYAEGYWGFDQLTLEGTDISNLEFAVATVTNSSVGVLGVGLENLESTFGYTNASNTTYPNFPVVLKENGAIQKIAYSLYLNQLDAESGSILFGGVDHSKYQGGLYTYPLANIFTDEDEPIEFDVTVQAIGMQTKSACRQDTLGTAKFTGLLDSGTTLLYIHEKLADKIADYVNGTWSDYYGLYMFDCPTEDDDTEIVYDFGGLQVTTPIQNYVLATEDPTVCGLGIVPSGFYSILGDVFLSSAYVVYDLENLEVSIAQAKYDDAVEDIEEIISTVPGAQKGAGYSNTYTGRAKDIATVTSNMFTTTLVCNISTTPSSTSLSSTTSSNSLSSFASKMSTRSAETASVTSSPKSHIESLSTVFLPSDTAFNLSTTSAAPSVLSNFNSTNPQTSTLSPSTNVAGSTKSTDVTYEKTPTAATSSDTLVTATTLSLKPTEKTTTLTTVLEGESLTVTTCDESTVLSMQSSSYPTLKITTSTTIINGETFLITTCPQCTVSVDESSITVPVSSNGFELTSTFDEQLAQTSSLAFSTSVSILESGSGAVIAEIPKFEMLTTLMGVVSVVVLFVVS